MTPGAEREPWARAPEGDAYVRDQLTEKPHSLAGPRETYVNEIFDSIPYEMGTCRLRMLEVKVGTTKCEALLK